MCIFSTSILQKNPKVQSLRGRDPTLAAVSVRKEVIPEGSQLYSPGLASHILMLVFSTPLPGSQRKNCSRKLFPHTHFLDAFPCRLALWKPVESPCEGKHHTNVAWNQQVIQSLGTGTSIPILCYSVINPPVADPSRSAA